MKILYLTPGCFDKGGISRYNRYQISALRELVGERNVRVLSLLSPDEGAIEEPMEVYASYGPDKRGKLSFALTALRLAIGWKPDLIFSGHIHFARLTNWCKRVSSAQVIQDVYGLELWSGRDELVAYGLRCADHVISDCHNSLDYIKNKGWMEHTDSSVIWDCVDLEKFRYDETRFDEIRERYDLPDRANNIVILTLGRLAYGARHKGYHRLLEAFSTIADQFENARLVIAGKGDMSDDLKSLADELKISERVVFTGMIHEDDMGALYSYAHIFSLVSEVSFAGGEGIPLTPLEAMACHNPIIVGNEDGSREAIFDNQNGYSIDPKNLDKHAEYLSELISNIPLRGRMAIAARDICETHFSYKGFVEKHRELLEILKE